MSRVRKGQKLVLVMVGLPARGKSYTSRRQARYLSWLGYVTRVFNLGEQRRTELGPAQTHEFFDPANLEAADVRQAMWASVEAVFADPRLAGCFDPATRRGEVPLLGTIVTKHGPRPVSGQVDRIAEFAHEVVVLDFKTGAHVPSSEAAIPEDYVAQMALYQDLVARLYGGKPVRCMLGWTHGVQGPVVMEVPQSAMSASLHKIAQL